MPEGERIVNTDIWETLYQSLQKPKPGPAITGFNANIDRVIPVTADLLASFEEHTVPGFDVFLPRLKHSMQYCSADELFVSDHKVYQGIADFFSTSGTLAIGGQAGIAAIQMHRLGMTSVTCAVPGAGRMTHQLLRDAGVIPLTFEKRTGYPPDSIHIIFEYPPGLVPVANGVVPRGNRFIISPIHDPSTAIIPDACENSFLKRIASCERAFLSGYQYLRTKQEFVAAARQIRLIRSANPHMRTHVESVSGLKRSILAMMLRYIIPNTDSIGLNERELAAFLHAIRAPDHSTEAIPSSSPVELVRQTITFARATGVPRVHLHTFGYFLLLQKPGTNMQPEVSRNALLLAARSAADAAGGDEQGLSQEGLHAYADIRESFGQDKTPGIFRVGDRVLVIVPTYISQHSQKTSGLGDIISSTSFVADAL